MELKLLIVLFILQFFTKAQSYEIILTNIDCEVNPEYYSKSSCEVNNTGAKPTISAFAGVVLKKVKNAHLNIQVFMDRSRRDSVRLLSFDFEWCKFFKVNQTNPILKIVKEGISRAGHLPTSCHFQLGENLHFRDIVIDTDYLPKYVPNAVFRFLFNVKDQDKTIWKISLNGKVVNRRTNKEKLPRLQMM